MRLIAKHHEGLASGVARLVAREITRAVKEIGGGKGQVSDEGVHEARRALKRARAGLRLIRAGLKVAEFKRENKALRKAGRAMSGARDEQVIAQTVGLLAKRAAIAAEKEAVAELTVLLHIKLNSTALDSKGQRRVVEKLKAVRARVRRWQLNGDDGVIVEGGLARAQARYLEAMRGAFEHENDEALHAWRRRTQDLRHQLAMVEEALPKRGRGMMKRARELSDLLGVDHDMAVLSQRMVEQPGGSVKVRVVIERMIGREREGLQRRAKTAGIRV